MKRKLFAWMMAIGFAFTNVSSFVFAEEVQEDETEDTSEENTAEETDESEELTVEDSEEQNDEDDYLAEPNEQRSSEGEAYAVLDDYGHMIFFRSENTYTNLSEGTFSDILGNEYSGKVFSGIETLNITNQEQIPWSDIKTVKVADGQKISPINMSWWFYQCKTLYEIDFHGFDTSNVTDMSHLFTGCIKLTTLDLSCFDTSNVTNMQSMFERCCNVESLDLSSFDTSNVTDMSNMFREIGFVETLNLSNFDTSNVTDMSNMFRECRYAKTIDISSFDTSNVTDMSGMFYHCSNLVTLDLSNFDTSNVTDMSEMFYWCYFSTLDISSFDTSNVTDMHDMFYDCNNLVTLDLSSFDTSNVTNMSGMFSRCENLTTLDVSGFDTSNVTDMSAMFWACDKITTLDVSGFDTGNVTDMSGMFQSCDELESLDLSSFDTSNVTDMSSMFGWCDQLKTLDLSSFDTSNVTDMTDMFPCDSLLEAIYVSDSWSVENVTKSGDMFLGCKSLPNYDSRYISAYKAYYGDKGYLSKKPAPNPGDEPGDDPSDSPFNLILRSKNVIVGEEFYIIGTYRGTTVDDFVIESSDPAAFELISFDAVPTGKEDEYTISFLVKITKPGKHEITVKNNDDEEIVEIEAGYDSLEFSEERYVCDVSRDAVLHATYVGAYPENIEVTISDPSIFASNGTIDYSKTDEENTYDITIKYHPFKTGQCDFELTNGELITTAHVVVDGDGFSLGIDNNCFNHTKYTGHKPGFRTVKNYYIPDKYFQLLTKDSEPGEKNNIKDIYMPDGWGGSCYGLIAVEGLLYEGYLNLSDLTDSEDKYYFFDLDEPYKDEKLLNAIQTMYLSQFLKKGGENDSRVAHTFNSQCIIDGIGAYIYGSCTLKQFFNQLIEYYREGHNTIFFGFTLSGKNEGHVVLITGYSYDEENEKHIFEMYDVNSVTKEEYMGKFGYMEVSKDLSYFSYTDGAGETLTQSTYQEMYFSDYSKMFSINGNINDSKRTGMKNELLSATDNNIEDYMTLRFAAGDSITLVNEDGQRLEYDGDVFSGDMPVYDLYFTGEGSNTDVNVEVPRSQVLNIEAVDESVDVAAYDDEIFLALSGTGIDHLEMNMNSSIMVHGSDYQFKAFVTTDRISENENGLISVSGNAESDVSLSKSGSGVKVSSEGELTDVTTASYEGVEIKDETYEQLDGEFTVSEDAEVNEKPEEISFTNGSMIELPTLQKAVLKYEGIPAGSITWTSDNEKAVTVDENGMITAKTYGKAVITATSTADPSVTAKCTVQTRFYDVNDSTQSYNKPVYWGADNGVVAGYDGGVYFGPDNVCTRAQFVTFLWRLAGKPEGKKSVNFKDISTSVNYYRAVKWAVSEGIIVGYKDDNTFRPDNEVTRGQVATMLWRFAGRKTPALPSTSPFSDINASNSSYRAVVWGQKAGVIKGYKDGTFQPDASCLRQHIVTFLYRYARDVMKKKV